MLKLIHKIYHNVNIKFIDTKRLKNNLKNYGIEEYKGTNLVPINDYYKENNTTLGHPEVPNETAMELDKRVKDGQATPYPGQFFTENRKEIDRLKAVIEKNKGGSFVYCELAKLNQNFVEQILLLE